jgi:hypothetical protein
MLKKAALLNMAKLLKIDTAKFEAAIASDKEEDIEIADDITIFNKTELETRDRNTYDKAKKAGEEMLVKDFKKKHGIEINGEDPDKLMEALTAKVKKELDVNPDARVVELTKTVDSTKRALQKANELADQYKNQMENFQTDTKLLGMLPPNRSEVMNTDEFLAMTKSQIKIETRDGKEVAIRNGQVVVDPKTQEPLPPGDVIKGYFTERKGWLKEEETPMTGRGGGNSNTPGGRAGRFTKISEVRKDIKDRGISLNGDEAFKIIQAAQKENPELDMRS